MVENCQMVVLRCNPMNTEVRLDNLNKTQQHIFHSFLFFSLQLSYGIILILKVQMNSTKYAEIIMISKKGIKCIL